MLGVKIPLNSLIFKYNYFNKSKFQLNNILLNIKPYKIVEDVF